MPEYLVRLFSSAGFMPHGMCYQWQPDILALHIVSDSLIALAYFSIPPTLLYFSCAARGRTSNSTGFLCVSRCSSSPAG